MKLIFILTLTISLIACEKKNEINDAQPSSDFEKLLDSYGLFNSEKEFESYAIGLDTSLIYFNGRLHNKLCVESFRKSSYENLLSWKSKDELIIDVHEGYGVNSTHKITEFRTVTPLSYNNNHSFIMWGIAHGSQYEFDQRVISSNLYFSSSGKIYESLTYPAKDYFFVGILPWFEDNILVRKEHNKGWGRNRDSLLCYSIQGQKIYQVITSSDFELKNEYIPVSVNNYISYENYSGRFHNKSLLNNKVIWVSDCAIEGLPEDVRIDKLEYSRFDQDNVLCKIKYTAYSGEVGIREVLIKIKTGEFEII